MLLGISCRQPQYQSLVVHVDAGQQAAVIALRTCVVNLLALQRGHVTAQRTQDGVARADVPLLHVGDVEVHVGLFVLLVCGVQECQNFVTYGCGDRRRKTPQEGGNK